MARWNKLSTLVVGAALVFAGPAAAGPHGKKKPGVSKKNPAKPKKPPPVSAEHKKKLAELMGAFKFGMSKDEILGVLQKQLDERYADQIAATTDVAAQDRLRREKKQELDRVRKTYVEFTGKKTGWDVSLIEEQFAHNTGETMLVYWENQNGKNQRRFFFMYQGKLWRMFISLDTSMLPEDKRNFENFQGVMENLYGKGLVEPGKITWETSDFHVQALDRLKQYDALALVLWDPKVYKQVESDRKAAAPPPAEQNGVIKSVLDKGDEKPGLDENKGAVDAIINSNKTGSGGSKTP
jgi:hypothetical protein